MPRTSHFTQADKGAILALNGKRLKIRAISKNVNRRESCVWSFLKYRDINKKTERSGRPKNCEIVTCDALPGQLLSRDRRQIYWSGLSICPLARAQSSGSEQFRKFQEQEASTFAEIFKKSQEGSNRIREKNAQGSTRLASCCVQGWKKVQLRRLWLLILLEWSLQRNWVLLLARGRWFGQARHLVARLKSRKLQGRQNSEEYIGTLKEYMLPLLEAKELKCEIMRSWRQIQQTWINKWVELDDRLFDRHSISA